MTWSWAFTFKILPDLIHALGVTLLATVGGFALALLLGLMWAVFGRSRRGWLSRGCSVVVEFLRSTPLLVQIYFLFFVLPDLGIRLSPLTTGIAALGLYYSAYTSEVYRAAISAVPKGQWEAGIALNMRPWRLWRAVILPQALPPAVPVLGNYAIAMLKDTPLLAAITVVEVLQEAKLIGAETFRYLEPLTIVGLLYLGLSLVASRVVDYLEVRFGHLA